MKIHAEYQQFCVVDETANTSMLDWTKEDEERLLAIQPGILAVGTIRCAPVPVVLEIVDNAPDDDLRLWDHVNECSVVIPSGRVVIGSIFECDYVPDDRRFQLKPGPYRARLFYGGLDSLTTDGRGSDHYKVVLWPATPGPPFLKQASKKLLSS
jgi:hypothetical protein